MPLRYFYEDREIRIIPVTIKIIGKILYLIGSLKTSQARIAENIIEVRFTEMTNTAKVRLCPII